MRRHCFIVLLLAAAWLGLAQPGRAQGTIAYYQPPSPVVLRDEFFGQFWPFDMNGDGNPELTFAYNFQSVAVRYEQGTRSLSAMASWPDIRGLPQPLDVGFSIGPESASGQWQWFGGIPGEPFGFYSLVYITSGGTGGEFAGRRGYMGVEFQHAGGTHYGWISLYVDAFAPVAVIDSWAWETRAGVPILAGAVPEPSALALLVGGGVLMVCIRHRRNATKG